jgi:hypothetical protein
MFIFNKRLFIESEVMLMAVKKKAPAKKAAPKKGKKC